VLSETGAWELMRCPEQRQGDRQIESRALLLQLRWCEVDRDMAPRKLQLCGKNSTTYALLRFLAGAVGKPDDREHWDAVLQVSFDLDAARIEADERVRDRACEHVVTVGDRRRPL